MGNLCLPFSEVLLHTYKDCLREEEREVNHHGRVRKIGDEDEDYEENEVEIMKNNWMGNTGQLDLISRREDVQVAALKEHYRNLAANEKKLERADYVGFTVIPTIAGCFIAG